MAQPRVLTSQHVRKAIKDLNHQDRVKVNAMVREHVDACGKMGIDLENIDRVWIEAMERVELEKLFPEPQAVEPSYEPFRKYDQYTSPKDSGWQS